MVVICFQISIFEPLNTAVKLVFLCVCKLWFAFKLVSLSHWIQHQENVSRSSRVVICFQISIFEPLNTATDLTSQNFWVLWFAFKLVSLSHWIQRGGQAASTAGVVICFQISIFEPLNTALGKNTLGDNKLWFAFKLVSLSHWIQRKPKELSMTSCCDLLSN